MGRPKITFLPKYCLNGWSGEIWFDAGSDEGELMDVNDLTDEEVTALMKFHLLEKGT